MSPNPALSVSCTGCERLSVRITQVERRIETLLEICASEEFIDSIIALVQAVEPSCAKGLTQIFQHGITADVEPHTADLADTLPWMCPSDTGISGEAPKQAGPTDISYWNSVGAKPKSSTPARTWSHVVHRNGKPSMKPKPPALTPPPEVSLHNIYDPLIPNTMCNDECNTKIYKNK